MPLRLFNTLSGQVDELSPMDGKALRMYACGPTVYDYGHIGNFRTFLQIDVLRRTLALLSIPVRHVMNITDVDDKIICNAAEAGIPIAEYTAPFEQAFLEDLEVLGVERPEILARATEHIPRMVELIQKLSSAGAAYKTEDGSWYFRLASFPEYGKLSKKDLSGMEDGARVDLDEYEKDSARDFALWKAAKPGETYESADSPFGPGEALHCAGVFNQPVSTAAPVVAAKGLTVEWRVGNSTTNLTSAPAGDYVVNGIPISSTTVMLMVQPTPLAANTPDLVEANAGC